MTHTAGYEDYVKELFVTDPSKMQPLGQHVATHQPQRIFPPGTTPAYSNYATAVAGYIVERVSGKPFADYIEENITGPLGMKHATFRQPLPKDLEPLMSKGYKLASGKAQKFEYRHSVAGRRAGRLGRRHGALHDRAPAGRPLRGRPDPAARDRAAHARAATREVSRP